MQNSAFLAERAVRPKTHPSASHKFAETTRIRNITKYAFLPWVALSATVLIWAGYLVAIRAAAATTLTPNDVGLLRSVPAAILLLPLTFKHGLFPGGAKWIDVLLIGVLGGTFFTYILNTGAHFAPVADSAIFAPSTLPFHVTLLSLIFLGASFHRLQYAGVAIILFGAIAVGGYEALTNATTGAWKGHLLFLSASFCWAIYTVRFRASGLTATDGALILVTWSAILFLIFATLFGSNILAQSPATIAVQLTLGVSAGLIANFTFLFAVQTLGPAISAASAALVPVMAALGGWIFLSEPIGLLKAIGILIVAIGVLLASGIVGRKT